MPHLVIDYTCNLPAVPDFARLFAELHDALSATGEVEESHLKSRAVALQDFWIGDGSDPAAVFVHIKLHLLTGRSAAVKQRLVMAMRPIVAAHFAQSLAMRNCQLCIEIIDIDRETYAKVVSPTS
jgi:5-carboxymethyl-2-hydroxymuconate isomerase